MPEPQATRIPLLSIVGPTAVGKTDLAIRLALELDGEVVNADSRQVYRHMDIGTAKATAEQRALVPHHLVSILDPDESFGLDKFMCLSSRAIGDVHRRGKLPILVGGSGQYVWSLLEGWRPPRVPPNHALRKSLEEEAGRHGPQALFHRLLEVDPQARDTVDGRNPRRVIRALEVYEATGLPPSGQIRRKGPAPYVSQVVGLTMDRRTLYDRIDARVDSMMERGLLAETRRLLSMGYTPDLPSMSSVGYREMVLHLTSGLPLSDAVQRIKYATHGLARRQLTWFRAGDQRICWTEAGPKVAQRVRGLAAELRDSHGAPTHPYDRIASPRGISRRGA